MLNSTIKFFLENKLVTFLIAVTITIWGISTVPFYWVPDWFPSNQVAVDALPDIGENQQIVYAEWKGRSPQDIDDQITYPLTTTLLGIPGVKTIRSSSIFGLSSIYLIFEDNIDFYWSRSRILEKLSSLPSGTLPRDVQASLGPDATALGQVFWYTLEGRDTEGNPVGGWDPQELRSIQDFYVKYGLSAANGVSEVASIGGYVKEYQVEMDPVAMKSYGIGVDQIMKAVQNSNLDIGARTLEFNRAEYLVRGLGYIKNIQDIEEAVVKAENNIPIRVKDVAKVQLGPAARRGGLDKGGVEAVGAVVVARYGSNPLEVINNVKEKIKEIVPGLPSKVLADGRVSKVTLIPFYDRTGLIHETIGTLSEALSLEILISIIVVIILVLNLRASILISSLLPLGVLMTFIAMKYLGISANIVALSGIAISIGVMIDVGVVITENIIRHLSFPEHQDLNRQEKLEVVFEATKEVSSAVITALTTTIISFIPVFALEAQEGKLFMPLAYTKTLTLLAALLIGIVIIPAFAHWLLTLNAGRQRAKKLWNIALITLGVILIFIKPWAGIAMTIVGTNNLWQKQWKGKWVFLGKHLNLFLILGITLYFLSKEWLPLGASYSLSVNFIFVALIILLVLGTLLSVVFNYQKLLSWCLKNKKQFLSIPMLILLLGILSWQGFDRTFNFIASASESSNHDIRTTGFWKSMSITFPGLGREFMPSLDEGSYLLMPTTMPHSGVQENIETIQLLDRRVSAIPEVEVTVGKWGRAASALDPAPISMFENVVNYKSEYILDVQGYEQKFQVNEEGHFELSNGDTFIPGVTDLPFFDTSLLIKDKNGHYFRQWRDHIKSADDIWDEIVKATHIPGMTSAPKLQPIATRLIMLSTGMRAPMGIKVYGPTLKMIESVGLQIEQHLKQVQGVKPGSVFADRVVGKPYLEIDVDRRAIARYGLSIADIQLYIGVAIGGNTQTMTVEGRERYAVRVRYARELRDNPDALKNILIPTPSGVQVPLQELAELQYIQGPQNIKSENTFLVSYVIFDKENTSSEVEVVEQAKDFLASKIAEGSLVIPEGVSYKFAGNYENEERASKKLALVIPISLAMILFILYLQFKKLQPTLMVFSGVFVAFAGGFILLWLFGQTWFLNFSLFDQPMRELFQVGNINLSVAVWVGFIALFGIATDDGVIMGTYLKQYFEKNQPATVQSVREAVLHAGQKRVRPAMMTAGTTIIALIPILTSTGKGADIMVPMAIPMFGGMLVQMITIFVVPVLYSTWKEHELKSATNEL